MPEADRFTAIVREVIEPLRRYLHRRTDAATADDVLGDTLLVCWRRRAELPDDALPWVLGVARGCLANARRAARRRLGLVDRIRTLDPPTPADPGPEDSPQRAVAAVLARMRRDDAEVLRLWAWEELGPAAIATVLGISPNAASVRLHRARERFREIAGKTSSGAGQVRGARGGTPT